MGKIRVVMIAVGKNAKSFCVVILFSISGLGIGLLAVHCTKMFAVEEPVQC